MNGRSEVSLLLAAGGDPAADVPSDGCPCGPSGHRFIAACLEIQDTAAPPPLTVAANGVLPLAKPVGRVLRAAGLAFYVVGAEGGWPGSWWTASLTPAGIRHGALLRGDPDRHDGPPCHGAGRFDGDRRCDACGRFELLTTDVARVRIAAMTPGEVRDREAWASGFVCPYHGRARAAMVRTDKCCARCGELLIRRQPVA